MSKLESGRGRERNARATQEAILNAAETVFAEHGFDGARLDAIAKVADYNKSLIGQYFGDKLGLYTEVLKRADKEMNTLLANVITPLLTEETIANDAQGFRTFIATLVETTFDYFVDHPLLLRILTWEMAEGWQTYLKIASQFSSIESNQFEQFFAKAYQKGWLRSDFPAVIQLTLVFQTCQSFLAFLPMYRTELPAEDLSSAGTLARTRERLVAWVVGAMVVTLPELEKTQSKTGGDMNENNSD